MYEEEHTVLAIYAPMIYTAPYIMFCMRFLWGQVGGGLALWNGIEPIGECHMGPKKLEISRAQPPPTFPSNGYAHIQNIKYNAV